MQAVVPSCYTQNKQNKKVLIMVAYGGYIEEPHSLRKEAVLESGGMAADTSVSLAKWQQGEQAVAVCVLSFTVFLNCLHTFSESMAHFLKTLNTNTKTHTLHKSLAKANTAFKTMLCLLDISQNQLNTDLLNEKHYEKRKTLQS